jgi:hypothetical protein
MHYVIIMQAPDFAVMSTGAPSLISVNLFHLHGLVLLRLYFKKWGADFLLLQPDIPLHLVKLNTWCQQLTNSGLQLGVYLRTRTRNIRDRISVLTFMVHRS